MSRSVLLLEPNYKNKYPPMGLMKIATYYRNRGDNVRFFKGKPKELAANMLFEEFYQEIIELVDNGVNLLGENIAYDVIKIKNELGRYQPKYIEFITMGKHAPLDSIPNISDDMRNTAIKYRNRFKCEDYPKFDVVCITTLFTFYWTKTIETINFAKKICKSEKNIKVGGIAASLLSDKMFEATGIRPTIGQLHTPEDLGDRKGKKDNSDIDELPLDYSILDEIDYIYPANNAYFAYMTRGCINKCEFCAVPQLEPDYCSYISLRDQIETTIQRFGAKKDLLLLDNNAFASEQFDDIINEIIELGFEKGATYTPPNEYEIAINNLKDEFNVRAYTKKIISIYNEIEAKLSAEDSGNFYKERKKRCLLFEVTATKESILDFDGTVRPLYDKYFKQHSRMRIIDFNQGMDARLATNEKMEALAKVNIRPLRIAFDHYSMRSTYEKAIRFAAQNEIRDLSNYLLYNFHDKPEELYFRMRINIELCEELGVTIYSFPMKYHPIDDPAYFNNRDYIGEHWNRKFIRAIQAVLNATKGKIGRGKSFFEEAFGKDVEEFQKLLWMPETFIIYRRKYDKNLRDRLAERYTGHYSDESDLANNWWGDFTSLDPLQSEYVKSIVADNRFSDDICTSDDALIQRVLNYYKVKRDL